MPDVDVCEACVEPVGSDGCCPSCGHNPGRYQEALESAMAEFWREFASKYPEIESGDLPPDSVIRFEKEADTAAREWLLWNDYQRSL